MKLSQKKETILEMRTSTEKEKDSFEGFCNNNDLNAKFGLRHFLYRCRHKTFNPDLNSQRVYYSKSHFNKEYLKSLLV